MKKLFIFPFIFFIFFIFFGCSSAQITANTHKIFLEYKQNHIVVDAPTIKSEDLRFLPIVVHREIKKLPNGKYMLYEELKTDALHQFRFSIEKLLHTVFRSKETQLLERHGNIMLTQVVSKGKRINIIIENQNKKRLYLFYPVPNRAFENLLEEKNRKSFKEGFEAKDLTSLPTSDISPKSNILDNLTRKTGGKPLGR